ncbi:MAG TPA: YqaJ viral recombinase family protein [Anaeromyxobacter sp.]
MSETATPAAPRAHTNEELLELLALPERLKGQPLEADVDLSPEEKQFREEARTSIGGTDAAAIAGLSPYKTTWDVVAEKLGILPPLESSERMRWGLAFEEPVMAEYARRTGQKLERIGHARDPEKPFLGAHADRLVAGRKKGVEGKTVEWKRDEWSELGEPVRVPRHYYVQCQHYMGVFRYGAWDLVALFGLSKLRWYELEPNGRVISALRARCEEVWAKYVLAGELPPIEPSDRARAWLKSRHPEETSDELVIANEVQEQAVAHWLEAKGQREAAEKEEERWKLHVQQAIGDAIGIVAGPTTVTWKKNKDTTALVTDYEALLAHYAEKHGFTIDAEDILGFTKSVITRVGPRVLRPKETK